MPPPVGTRSRRVGFVIFFRTSYVGSKSRQHLRGRGRLSPISGGSHPPSTRPPPPRWSTWGIMAWFMYRPITSIGVSGAQKKDPSFNDHWWCKNWRGRGGMFNNFNPQMPKVKIHLRTPKGGLMQPPGFLPSRPNFLKIFLMGMFSGSRNPTVIMKKFYLYCMTLKIKVKHLFAWSFISPVANMIQSWSWCRF